MWSLRIRLSAFLLTVTLAASAQASLRAQAAQMTWEGLVSAPFPSGLTAFPTGGWVASVQNDQEARNIERMLTGANPRSRER